MSPKGSQWFSDVAMSAMCFAPHLQVRFLSQLQKVLVKAPPEARCDGDVDSCFFLRSVREMQGMRNGTPLINNFEQSNWWFPLRESLSSFNTPAGGFNLRLFSGFMQPHFLLSTSKLFGHAVPFQGVKIHVAMNFKSWNPLPSGGHGSPPKWRPPSREATGECFASIAFMLA